MKRRVHVTFVVDVTIDETKFTPEFMTEFRGYMYNVTSIEHHLEHLAQLHAREIDTGFIEGYGLAKDFGIKFEDIATEMEVISG